MCQSRIINDYTFKMGFYYKATWLWESNSCVLFSNFTKNTQVNWSLYVYIYALYPSRPPTLPHFALLPNLPYPALLPNLPYSSLCLCCHHYKASCFRTFALCLLNVIAKLVFILSLLNTFAEYDTWLHLLLSLHKVINCISKKKTAGIVYYTCTGIVYHICKTLTYVHVLHVNVMLEHTTKCTMTATTLIRKFFIVKKFLYINQPTKVYGTNFKRRT